MRHLTYYVAVSIDGFIAGPDHQTDGFDVGPELIQHIIEHYPETLPTPAREGLGLCDVPNQRFDTVLMGSKTYGIGCKEGLTSPYGHLDQVVFSNSLNVAGDPAVLVTAQDATSVAEKLKSGDGLDIWLCGGGQLAGALIDQIDELILKRSQTALGAGRSLFAGSYEPKRFELIKTEAAGNVAIETYRSAN